MITCFIVDDEPIARRGLREYITREGDIKILAECENIIELRMRLQEMSPDIIFLDIEMPYASGMDWLSTANTSSLVILTTAYEQYALRSYQRSRLSSQADSLRTFLKGHSQGKEIAPERFRN